MVLAGSPIFTGGAKVGAFHGAYLWIDSLRILVTAVGLLAMTVMGRFYVNLRRRSYPPMSRSGMFAVGGACIYVAFTELGRIGYEVAPLRLAVGVVVVVSAFRYALLLFRLPPSGNPWETFKQERGGQADPWEED